MDIENELPKRSNRNLSELYASSQSLLQQQPHSDAAVVGAQALLGSSFHYQPILERVTFTTGTNKAPDETRAYQSLEDQVSQQEQDILMSMLQRVDERNRAKSQELIEAQLKSSWERDRQVWLQELIGNRTLGGAAAAGGAPNARSPAAGLSFSAFPGRIGGATAMPRSPVPLTSPTPRAAPDLDLPSVQAHLDIVRDKLTRNASAEACIQAFLDLPAYTVDNQARDAGYRTSWQLLLQLQEAASKSASLSAVDQAKAALACWTLQFQTHVYDRIRQARRPPSPKSFASDLAHACVQYVTLTIGTPLTNSSNGSAWWPVVFYCLRCGDPKAALEVVEQRCIQSTPAVPDSVIGLLRAYSAVQGDEPSLWTVGSLPRLNPNDVASVKDLVGTHCNDLFLSGSLALLSCSPLPSNDSTIGFCNIEDYLTSNLWQAVLSSEPENDIAKLGRSMRDFGPSYFSSQEAWAYSLPLLATQQYASALQHLVRVGGPVGLMQACHLALALHVMGVALHDYDDKALPQDSSTVSPSNFVASLLVEYAYAILPLVGAGSAVEYVVRIPNKARATKEVAQFISKTGNLSELVGVVNGEGLREGGSSSLNTFGLDLAVVLGEAAGILLRGPAVAREQVGTAAMCYMLAGRYADVLQLLSRHISPPEHRDPDREYWLNQTESFHEFYLAKRTQVAAVLERSAHNVVLANCTLLGLNRYFALLTGNRQDEAWELLGHLNLLPLSRNDLANKEASIRGQDALVQQAMPAVLTSAMQSLFDQHQTLQRQIGREVAASRLQQVKEQARVYAAFAGMIGLTGNAMQAVSRLEALMS